MSTDSKLCLGDSSELLGSFKMPRELADGIYMVAAFGAHRAACVTSKHQLVTFDTRHASSKPPAMGLYHPSSFLSMTVFPLSCPILQVSCGDKNVYVLTTMGLVFSSGSNCCGEGGTGSMEDTTDMMQVKLPEHSRAPSIMVAAGASHCLCVSSSGKLYGWGRNAEGQLGRPDPSTLFTPKYIHLEAEGVGSVFIAAGGHSSAIVATDGSLFVCGSNRHGQLGMGSVNCVWSVSRVRGLMPVKVASCSETKTFVLCRDASVWHCGIEKRSTSFLLLPSAHGKFHQVDTTRLPVSPSQIICGHDRTVIVDAHGGVFSCVLPVTCPWNGPYNYEAVAHPMPMFITTAARTGDFIGPSVQMLLAFAMGVHHRLGLDSHVQTLARVNDVLSLILRGSRTDIFAQCSMCTPGISYLLGGDHTHTTPLAMA